jgi:ketosteroid isomerase-like protein
MDREVRHKHASMSMTAGARTPEELDTLIEDAFLQHDRAALGELFADGAVLMDCGGVPAHGRDAIGHAVSELWDHRRTYVARTLQVLQADDTALVVSQAGIHVLRRGGDGAWRIAISMLDLDGRNGSGKA